MAGRAKIPPVLEPYLRLPPTGSLVLLTGTLGCSNTWLTARAIGAALSDDNAGNDASSGATEEVSVVLVSLFRDVAFWKGELKRSMGNDLSRPQISRRLQILDMSILKSTLSQPTTALPTLQDTILKAIASNHSNPTLLILDGLDLLIALGLASAQDFLTLTLTLRSNSHSLILATQADGPLVSAATLAPGAGSPTPLECEAAAFMVQAAHAARWVVGVRELDTGAARDVSGVVSVTRGGGAYGEDGEGGQQVVREMEALFLVGRDGTAKVFERGAGD